MLLALPARATLSASARPTPALSFGADFADPAVVIEDNHGAQLAGAFGVVPALLTNVIAPARVIADDLPKLRFAAFFPDLRFGVTGVDYARAAAQGISRPAGQAAKNEYARHDRASCRCHCPFPGCVSCKSLTLTQAGKWLERYMAAYWWVTDEVSMG